jgi:dephospho-CoA kinase
MSLKVGITGGIGSGKTTVCKVFELLGIPVFYADEEAKSLMIKDEGLVSGIKLAFGEEAYSDTKTLNRKYLSNLVFKFPKKLEKLNELVHPAVFRAFDFWCTKQSSAYVLKEAALLFESGSYKKNEFNILVTCPLILRIKRVMNRDHVIEEKVLERIANQFTEEQSLALANFIIYNNEQEFIIPQVIQLHDTLMKEAAK